MSDNHDMWRAAGIILLLVSQDLGRPFHHRLQEFTIRPPAGWIVTKPDPPAFIEFAPVDKPTLPCGLEVKHLHTGNPTPQRRFVAEAKPVFKLRFKDAVFQEEKELTINGRPAYRIVFSHGDRLEVKTVIPRSNLEFYLIDAWMGKDDAAKYRPAVEAAMASFEVVPMPLTSEERTVRA